MFVKWNQKMNNSEQTTKMNKNDNYTDSNNNNCFINIKIGHAGGNMYVQ